MSEYKKNRCSHKHEDGSNATIPISENGKLIKCELCGTEIDLNINYNELQNAIETIKLATDSMLSVNNSPNKAELAQDMEYFKNIIGTLLNKDTDKSIIEQMRYIKASSRNLW